MDRYPVEKRWWGTGPWQNEPDHYEWESRGYPCFIHRGFGGSWAGYVVLPSWHPWYGLYELRGVSIHGGLTWFGAPEQTQLWYGEEQLKKYAGKWLLGFDCGHAYDYAPALEAKADPKRHRQHKQHYWTQEEVMAETERLVTQAEQAVAS